LNFLARLQVHKVQLAGFALTKRGALAGQPAFVAPEVSRAADDPKVQQQQQKKPAWLFPAQI
jgi:hypothetical protein